MEIPPLDQLSGKLSLYACPRLVVGDFNAHVGFGNRPNSRGRALSLLMMEEDMVLMNGHDGMRSGPTYIQSGHETTIDLAYASADLVDDGRVRLYVCQHEPESPHSPLVVWIKHAVKPTSGASIPYQVLPFPTIPRVPDPSHLDSEMADLLSQARSPTPDEQVPIQRPLIDDETMASVRRRMSRLRRGPWTPEDRTLYFSLRNRWTALRLRKKWAAQAALMKRMYELRGKRPYWTHINKTRQVSTSINLDPLSVYSHFKQLMAAPDASVIEVDPDVDEAHPLLDDILTTADVCDGLARLKNSAKGEDNLTAAKFRTIDPDEIADFFA
ncbi:hypothetical protein DFH27DRAFT_606049 [Peziza echinospora]|nr:hypothetical protein DFH27DRAFT_606049 [Peziza echinospora]